jgi:cytidylate kinase
MRSCGEEVRRRARALGIEMALLSDDEHRQIDLATRTWAAGHRACIVEGRFLDLVFSGWHVGPRLQILLAAPAEVRYDRARAGGMPLGSRFEERSVRREDEFDLSFKQRMYPGVVGCPAQVTIDTSTASIEDCVACVRGHISGWGDGIGSPV